MGPFGAGRTSKISESLLNLQMILAFKRARTSENLKHGSEEVDMKELYRLTINELLIMTHPILYNHLNILRLEGILLDK